MKLILMSNMQCDYVQNDDNFFTMLNVSGLNAADNLEFSSIHNPDIIYCSPYLSSIQTIYPMCKNHEIKINIDNALYPINPSSMAKDAFLKENKGLKQLLFDDENPDILINDVEAVKHNYNELLTHYNYLIDIIDTKYKSSFLSNNISFHETDVEIKNRLFPFLYNLLQTFKNTNKTIMIVSDNSICNYVTKYFKKNELFYDGKCFSIEFPCSNNILSLE